MTTVPAASASATVRGGVRPRSRSGSLQRLLAASAVVVLPLQDHLPPIAGFSVIYLAFAFLAVVAVLGHPGALLRAAMHPIFVTAYILIATTGVIELLHTNSDLLWWSRMAQMVAGGVVIASFVRSDRDVSAVLTGFVAASLWVAVMIIRSSYGVVASAGAAGFNEASQLRATALSGLGLRANWNMLALLCAAAAGVTAARTILSRDRTRFVYALITLVVTMAVFMTFSRSGAAALALTLGYVFVSLLNRKLMLRLAGVAAAVLLVVWLAIPHVIFQRFEISTNYDAGGQQESRVMIYGTLLRALPSYFVTGVGSGNYWSTWAFEHGLYVDADASGAHNTFLQVTVFWGIAGLLTWSLVLFLGWRTLMRSTRGQLKFTALKAVMVTVGLSLMVGHDIADKQLSIALGTIVGVAEYQRRESRAGKTRPAALIRRSATV